MARVLYATGVTAFGAALGTGFGFAVGMLLMPAPPPGPCQGDGIAMCSYMVMSGIGGAFLALTLAALRQRTTTVAAFFSFGIGAIFGYFEPQILDGLFGKGGPHRFFLHFLYFDEYETAGVVIFAFAFAIFVGLFCGTCFSNDRSNTESSGPQ